MGNLVNKETGESNTTINKSNFVGPISDRNSPKNSPISPSDITHHDPSELPTINGDSLDSTGPVDDSFSNSYDETITDDVGHINRNDDIDWGIHGKEESSNSSSRTVNRSGEIVEDTKGEWDDPNKQTAVESETKKGYELSENDDVNDDDSDDLVPMVFRWEGGGRNVYITGTFNKWSEKIPMRRSGNDFLYIRELKRGWHAYKFIVDDSWRFAPDQPTVADPNGYINNYVDLSKFEISVDIKPPNKKELITSDELYHSFLPDPNDPQWYAKEPPALPPHLRNIILNTPHSDDFAANKSMEIPQQVTLNHLYCSAIKENLMVLGVTQRYKEKFCTVVLYSPLPQSLPQNIQINKMAR